jgi:hypothetical protein
MRRYLQFLFLAMAFLLAGCVAQDGQVNDSTNPSKSSSSSSSSSSTSSSSTSSSGYFDDLANCNLEKNPSGLYCRVRQDDQLCGCDVIKGQPTCGCATFPVDAAGQFVKVCNLNNQCENPRWSANCNSNVAPCNWQTRQGDWARCDIGGNCLWSGASAASSSSSSSTSSSGAVVFKPGDWNAASCTLNKSENHPCQYRTELSVCGCNEGTCGCASTTNAVDPNLVWSQTRCHDYSPNRPCKAAAVNYWINCDATSNRCDFESGVYGQPGWSTCTGSTCSWSSSSSSSSSSSGASLQSTMVNTANQNNPRGCSESSVLECQLNDGISFKLRHFDTLVAAINAGSTEAAVYGADPSKLGDIKAPAPLTFTEDQFFTGGKAVTLTNTDLLATTLPTSATVRTGRFSYKIPVADWVRARVEIRLVPISGIMDRKVDYQVTIESQSPRTFTFISSDSSYSEQILAGQILAGDGSIDIDFDFPSDEIGVGSILLVKD